MSDLTFIAMIDDLSEQCSDGIITPLTFFTTVKNLLDDRAEDQDTKTWRSCVE